MFLKILLKTHNRVSKLLERPARRGSPSHVEVALKEETENRRESGSTSEDFKEGQKEDSDERSPSPSRVKR